jgi:anti-anti-sigma factor
MSGNRHLELARSGAVSEVRLLHHMPVPNEAAEVIAAEWNSLAEISGCHTLFVDCSRLQFLSSDMLSKLILLQRRLKQKETRLVLVGLRKDAREVLTWTKLDRFFVIQEDAERDVLASA